MGMRDRLLSGFLLLLFAAFPAFGQGGFTTVSGAIVDPSGIPWSGGTISAQFITPGGTTPTLNGQPFTSTTASGLLGPGGTFTMRLGDNGVIACPTSPCGTWQFTINIAPGVLPPAGKGPQSFTVTTAINCGTNTPSTCTSNSMTITATLVPVPALTFTTSGGGGIVTVTGLGSVTATSLATAAGQTLFMDTKDDASGLCSLAGTPAVVTCSAPRFTCPADSNKVIWAQSGGALSLADSTITVCTDSQHVTASTGTIIGGAITHLRWGHNDQPAWDAVNTAYNNLLANGPVCLLTPSGLTTVTHASLVVNPTGGYSVGAYGVCYQSLGETIFSPVPDFNWTFYNPAASNIEFVSTAQGVTGVGGPTPSLVYGILVDGAGLNSGTGTCNQGGQVNTGMFLSQADVHNTGINNWCDGVSYTAVAVNNVQNIYDFICINSGSSCAVVAGSSDFGPVEIHGGSIGLTLGTSGALKITTSTNTHHVVFYPTKGMIQVTGSSVWHSDGDTFAQVGGGGPTFPVSLNNTSISWIDGCFMQTVGAFDLVTTNNTATAHLRNCKLNANAGQFVCNSHTSGGTCYDDGGNTITGSFSSDAIPTTSNGFWGIGTGVATAATTLFLVGRDSSTNAFTNTTATTVSGVAPFTGTLSNLVCTSTAAGVNASSGAVTVRLAPLSTGTFAASTLTATFGTTTSAKDQTHTAAITQGQPIQFQVTTQAAETLAGVQCRVQEN
jgi:hypothetical protein